MRPGADNRYETGAGAGKGRAIIVRHIGQVAVRAEGDADRIAERRDTTSLAPLIRIVKPDRGEVVKPPPTQFDTLLYLVQNRGRVVENDELLAAV